MKAYVGEPVEDLPPRQRGAARGSGAWTHRLLPLMDDPRRWYRFGPMSAASANSLRTRIKGGTRHPVTLPRDDGIWEATARNKNGSHYLYVRYKPNRRAK